MIKSFLILLILTASAASIELTGNIENQIYFFEQNDSSHVRIYESLRSNIVLWHSRNFKSLEFHSYLRYISDLKNKNKSNPQLYIYDSYIKLKNIPLGSEIRFGRQFVYNSIGGELVDGLNIKGSLFKNIALDLYAGSQVNHQDPESIQSISDYGAFGVMISYKFNNYRLGTSWRLKNLAGDIASHFVATEFTIRKSKYFLLNQFIFNLNHKRAAGILSRISYNYKKYYFSAEFQWREPSVRSSSLFSLIDFRKYKEFRFEFHRRIVNSLSIVSAFDIHLYKGGNGLGGQIGLNGGNWSLSWLHNSGLGRNSNGLIGFIYLNLSNSIRVYYNGRFIKYKIQELQSGLNDSYMSIIGAEFAIKRDLSIRSELQYLRNGIFKNDIRFNLNINKSFRINSEYFSRK